MNTEEYSTGKIRKFKGLQVPSEAIKSFHLKLRSYIGKQLDSQQLIEINEWLDNAAEEIMKERKRR
jgi:hypothetical protein